MQIHYLEIVTKDVDAVCAAYAAVNGVQFDEPNAGILFTLPVGRIEGLSST